MASSRFLVAFVVIVFVSSSSSSSPPIEVRLLRTIGAEVEIPCYRGDNAPAATSASAAPHWFKDAADGSGIVEASNRPRTRIRPTSEGDVLVIQSLQFEDAGKYTCVHGEPELTTVTYLTLMRPIRCPSIEQPAEVKGGDRLQWRCTIESLGSDVPKLVWELGSKIVPTSGQRREQTVSGCFYTIQDLVYRPDYVDDGERLQCRAQFQAWNPDEASLTCGRTFRIFNKPEFTRNISCPNSVNLDLTNALKRKDDIACSVSSAAEDSLNASHLFWKIGRRGKRRSHPESATERYPGGIRLRCPVSLSDLGEGVTQVTLTVGAVNGEEVHKVIPVKFVKGLPFDDAAFSRLYLEVLGLSERLDRMRREMLRQMEASASAEKAETREMLREVLREVQMRSAPEYGGSAPAPEESEGDLEEIGGGGGGGAEEEEEEDMQEFEEEAPSQKEETEES